MLDGAAIERIRRVGGDALLHRMIAAFLEHTPAHVETALAAVDAEAVMRAAHALKSSAANLGLAEVARIAGTIEERAAGADASYAALRPQLARAYEAGRDALERELGGNAA